MKQRQRSGRFQAINSVQTKVVTYLDFDLELTLEAREENFALTGLETVDNRRN